MSIQPAHTCRALSLGECVAYRSAYLDALVRGIRDRYPTGCVVDNISLPSPLDVFDDDQELQGMADIQKVLSRPGLFRRYTTLFLFRHISSVAQ